MQLTTVVGMQSEVFAPTTPPPVWTPVTRPLAESCVAFATAGGIHLKSQTPFYPAGDFSIREIPSTASVNDMMVTHGGYDNSDVNKDINAMLPVDRLNELAEAGFIGSVAPTLVGFMGGGGNVEKFKKETGPAIARIFKNEGVDLCVLTAGWGTCHRSAVIVQRTIEEAGIPTIMIAALPPVCKQQGAPRVVAPRVPMGANAGEPNNKAMQMGILKDALECLMQFDHFGQVQALPYEYKHK